MSEREDSVYENSAYENSGYENEHAAYDEEMEYAVPVNATAAVLRLWRMMGRERIRLMIVAASVIFYTILSVAAPVYSAGIVDLLW